MIIKTELRSGKTLIRDRILLSELELLHLHPATRRAIIDAAKRLSLARCLNEWRRQQTTNKKPNE